MVQHGRPHDVFMSNSNLRDSRTTRLLYRAQAIHACHVFHAASRGEKEWRLRQQYLSSLDMSRSVQPSATYRVFPRFQNPTSALHINCCTL